MFAVRATRETGWLSTRTGWSLSSASRAIEAVDERTGRIVGMVGFDGWTHNAAQAHIALDVPVALRRLIPPAFGYIFREAGKGVLLTYVSSANDRSLRLMDDLEFTKIARIPDAITVGTDLLLFVMRRETCRWLED